MLYPHLHLLVSGGNTQLIYMQSWDDYKIIGATLDDAAGECFDKTARMTGLPYPGGVYLSKIAGKIDQNSLKFPVSMKQSGDYNFSFSGLKTAVRYFLEKQIMENNIKFELEKRLTEVEIEFLTTHSLEEIRQLRHDQFRSGQQTPIHSGNSTQDHNSEILNYELLAIIKEVCISVQSAIVEALLFKVNSAAQNLEIATIGLSGGVSANPLLRSKLFELYGERLLLAPKNLTGDNAVMIGLAGILDWKYSLKSNLRPTKKGLFTH